MKNKKMLMIIIAFFMGITGLIYSFSMEKNTSQKVAFEGNVTKEEISNHNLDDEKEENIIQKDLDEDNNLIYVYICGCVNNPGVYTFKSGDRVNKAIEAAGGMTSNAKIEYINQAKLLADADKIYVPSIEEIEEKSLDMIELKEDTSFLGSQDNSKDQKININIANEQELMTLSGIGQSRAKEIISYREKNGNFTKIEDIMNVTGIKDALFDKICESITV